MTGSATWRTGARCAELVRSHHAGQQLGYDNNSCSEIGRNQGTCSPILSACTQPNNNSEIASIMHLTKADDAELDLKREFSLHFHK